MNSKGIARLHYFAGENLQVRDFQVEQQYNLSLGRAYNRAFNTYGIANGLELDWQQGAIQVRVGPGMAIDGQGRQIILTAPRLITLDSTAEDGYYYLTISYHEELAQPTEVTGVRGFTRWIQRPRLEFSLNHNQPNIDILLGIVNLENGKISELNYQLQNGKAQRQYCGLSVGAVQFVLPDAGIENHTPASAANMNNKIALNFTVNPAIGMQYDQKLAGLSTANIMSIDASRVFCGGMSTIASTLGIGSARPGSAFSVQATLTIAEGTLTSDGNDPYLLHYSAQAIYPLLQAGDEIFITQPDGTLGQAVLIVEQVDLATIKTQTRILPPLKNASFHYKRKHLSLATVNDQDGQAALQITAAGAVQLGMQSGAGKNQPSLWINQDKNVGIGLSTPPSATLEVGGDIRIAGAISSSLGFQGEGSQLQNVNVLWQKYDKNVKPQPVPASPTPIYYNNGNIAVGMAYSSAKLGVAGGSLGLGTGTITSVNARSGQGIIYKLLGHNTRFTTEIAVNDEIVVGVFPADLLYQSRQIAAVQSDTQLTLAQPFAQSFSEQPYDIIRCADANLHQENIIEVIAGMGTISAGAANQLLGQNTLFTAQIEVGKFSYIRLKDQFLQTNLVTAIVSDTELHLLAPFQTGLTDAQFHISHPLLSEFRNADKTLNVPPVLVARSNTLPNTIDEPTMLTTPSLSPDHNQTGMSLAGATQAPASGSIGINVDVPNPAYALDVKGDVFINGAVNTASSGMVPLNSIWLWFGKLDEVPAGWVLCDGNAPPGVPNLQNRFIYGWGDSVLGAIGGEETHTLSLPEMPQHNHNITMTQDGHNHQDYVRHATINYDGFFDPNSQDIANWDGNGGAYTDYAQPAIHTTEANQGQSQAHDNMPPYYVLAYIMKVAE